ncbi:hypothetical protein [Planobispora rosea]|uniref:hypothetical protein n=1 Tax=Planobispora rosea TaxID=35762 RepID=UPI00083AA282|nr:hypothetical protein [Planobispora rosea]
MKEIYEINKDGDLTITWEAETDEDMAELKETALAIARGEVPLNALPDPHPCPQGCGRMTEDPYGGPCRACWDAAPMLGEGGGRG